MLKRKYFKLVAKCDVVKVREYVVKNFKYLIRYLNEILNNSISLEVQIWKFLTYVLLTV